MKRYAAIFFCTLLGLLLSFSAFNLITDPYDVTSSDGIEGFNLRKTRSHEDGRRVLVSHQVTHRAEQSLILGSSRVVDGFPETSAAWPGGLYNAGMRGSNAYELAFAAALASRKDDLRCLIIGLDVSEFSGQDKFKSAFLISRFADGRKNLSLGRMMLSPNTFMRSVQTIRDNRTGGSDTPPFKEYYEPGEQRRRFLKTPQSSLTSNKTLTLDTHRIDYLFTSLEKLAANGVQIIGYIHPIHAWSEESLFRSGQQETNFALRKDLAARFEALKTAYDPASPCTPDNDAVLWDFSGFQPFATTQLPGVAQEHTHPFFHEPAHYLPNVGLGILARLQDHEVSAVIPNGVFGLRLTPENAQASEDDILARRSAYLTTPEGQQLSRLLDEAEQDHKTPPPVGQQPLTKTDWKQLHAVLDKQ